MQDFEKLGVFYLGAEVDPATRKRTDDLLLYDSRDLVTHAVCVGMTGSGKTGLCLDLIEEAAIDGVPALLIDPKGDLGNLLLTFPRLQGSDFRPWINEDDARRQGIEPDAFAEQQAELWKKGLADWGQQPDRIQRLRDAAEFAIYTPGSLSGRPLSVIASFAAPPEEARADGDLYRQRIATTATSLLGLLGIDADPLRSREHILLSTLFDQFWSQGKDLDLAQLVGLIQNPPVTKVGVLDVESFYPAKERFTLAMQLNNLIASPSFAAWTAGEPLDVGRLLYGERGKPRVSILSIAHLSDGERMFFVSLLLSQVLTWMQSQVGTTSLRALLYMDEVSGYMPPVANPPSKPPFLSLFKHARAFGLGIVVATQNPVDLDYKALSNAGTWLLGRLQTERDKQRVLDGLEGVSQIVGSGFERSEIDKMLSNLGKRQFIMQNVHDEHPVLFESRWAMSYLRGPLTLQQIQKLTPQGVASRPATAAAPAVSTMAKARPVVPPDIDQVFLPLRGSSGGVVYRPFLLGTASVTFSDAKIGVDQNEALVTLTPLTESAAGLDWDGLQDLDLAESDLETQPVAQADWEDLPSPATKSKSYAGWKRDLSDALFRTQQLEIRRSAELGLASKPGESERDFRIRLGGEGRQERDRQIEALRQKYGPKVAALQERIRKAESAVDREKSQTTQQTVQAALSVGAAVLGSLFGRGRMTANKAVTAARGVGRAFGQHSDVNRAEDNAGALTEQLQSLQSELDAQVKAIGERADPLTTPLEVVAVRPKKSGVEVRRVALAWAPHRRQADGSLDPSWG
ncbi:MAG: ATP-binding protein [Acidobacteriota bacterium]